MTVSTLNYHKTTSLRYATRYIVSQMINSNFKLYLTLTQARCINLRSNGAKGNRARAFLGEWLATFLLFPSFSARFLKFVWPFYNIMHERVKVSSYFFLKES